MVRGPNDQRGPEEGLYLCGILSTIGEQMEDVGAENILLRAPS